MNSNNEKEKNTPVLFFHHPTQKMMMTIEHKQVESKSDICIFCQNINHTLTREGKEEVEIMK